jgi:hypothetical protein
MIVIACFAFLALVLAWLIAPSEEALPEPTPQPSRAISLGEPSHVPS